MGDGITPNLTAVLETEYQDDFDASPHAQPAKAASRPAAARPPEAVTTMLPAAFGLQPLAPVRRFQAASQLLGADIGLSDNGASASPPSPGGSVRTDPVDDAGQRNIDAADDPVKNLYPGGLTTQGNLNPASQGTANQGLLVQLPNTQGVPVPNSPAENVVSAVDGPLGRSGERNFYTTTGNNPTDTVNTKGPPIGENGDATTQSTANPGVVVHLPNGQSIPDKSSATGALMSPSADLSAVAAAGRQTGAMYRSLLNNPDASDAAMLFLLASLGAALGHGDTFDYQRRGNLLTGYTQLPQFRNVSNVNVGLFCQQAGLTLDETLSAGGLYARALSSNARPHEPHGLDPRNTQFTTTGFKLGQSGMFDGPAVPQ